MTVREDANKDVVRRFVAEWLQGRDAAALRRLCRDDMSFDWGILGAGRGIEALQRSEDGARAAFPDLEVHSRLLVAEADVVVNVSDVSGTQRGAWLGVPPTGLALSWTAAEIYRLSSGKISHRGTAVRGP